VSAEGATTERLDHQQLLRLIIGWGAAALLPGIVTINQRVILAYIVWGIGFFVALGLFIVIARLTQTTELWPWMTASILPWVVNLSVPDNPMYIPVLVIAAGAFGAWIYLRSTSRDRLLHDGVEGTGTVIEVIEPKAVNAVVNNGYVRRSVRVTVTRADKVKTYEAVVRDLFKVEELPKPGDELPLRIDPEDAKRVVLVPPEKPVAPPAEAAVEVVEPGEPSEVTDAEEADDVASDEDETTERS
jgi:hypothetical protein